MSISVRNKDLTWPEEMSQLAKNKTGARKEQGGAHSGLLTSIFCVHHERY